MRAISKGTPERALAQRHRNPPTTAREAETAWGNFRGERRRGTVNKCLEEQYHLCGYSEVDLDQDGFGMHLEHLEPKSLTPARTFDHANLILSAISSERLETLDPKDRFGGHAKGIRFSATGFIHPLNPDCARYFHYEASSGRVVPNARLPRRERAKARLTIHLLNLNAPVLVRERRLWLGEAQEVALSLVSSPEALRNFAQCELLPTHGWLRRFHSGVRQLLGQIGDEVTRDLGDITA